jgi:hypothetical protein
LTAGSIEIEIMQRQISKKKLERLTIYGGDFRKAGERVGSNLTISRLRELLEDDVKNMDRNGRSGADISEKELNLVLDRELIFRSWEAGDESMGDKENSVMTSGSTSTANTTSLAPTSSSGCLIPMEGEMYDVVVVDESGSLGGVQ